MFRKMFFLLICTVTAAGYAQTQSSIPDNRNLVARAKSVCVESDTVFMKRENLESALLSRKEFKAWGLHLTNNPKQADLWVKVGRVPFRNHFTYAVIDHETETVLMAGQVDSLAGTVYGLIADEIVQKMKALRGDTMVPTPQPASKESTEPGQTSPQADRNSTPQLVVRGNNR